MFPSFAFMTHRTNDVDPCKSRRRLGWPGGGCEYHSQVNAPRRSGRGLQVGQVTAGNPVTCLPRVMHSCSSSGVAGAGLAITRHGR
jgi:hypothetical protein